MTDNNNNEKFLQNLPKIELHAHLSGCIRDSTIKELSKNYEIPIPETLLQHNSPTTTKDDINRRSLSECFSIFKSIHSILHTPDILKRVVWEALEDFRSSGVCYVELRSTPRIMVQNRNDDNNSTKEVVILDKYDYIMAVLETMQEFERKHPHPSLTTPIPKTSCRYIVSIDRSKGVNEAWENVKLACKIKQSTTIGKQRIVGVDVSGDPTKGYFKDLVPVLEYARTVGKLFVTIHIGEIPCNIATNTISDSHGTADDNDRKDNTALELERSDKEAMSILEFRPDRLGHALFLPQAAWESLLNTKYDHNSTTTAITPIPIECCPTSNILTIELASHTHEESITAALQHNKHPILKYLLTHTNYPMSISTDDPGVFHTDSCRELRLIMSAFPDIVTKEFIVERLVLGCLNQIFDVEVREDLEKLIRTELELCYSSCLD